ncbi:hypothetical protein [Curtobacterium sp. MCSS17_016]|uniref:hypothetical protein n=1 Tax=Curtobacterium sp. MCSS17_016 TaxID=2175644 RepID=UPI000DA9E4E3|nr:hypothetical protein [Curtobacterium sp. MCSS17_016]WIE81241.1 hypothetical protein DEJ19_018580 [Curtobacterium sp. MCSS17_016]
MQRTVGTVTDPAVASHVLDAIVERLATHIETADPAAAARLREEAAAVPRSNIAVIREAAARFKQRWDTVSPMTDPSTLYDLLHDAKRRLCAAINRDDRGDGPNDEAITAMIAVRAEVHAVRLDDLEAQRRLRDELHRRAAELERQHDLDHPPDDPTNVRA